MMHIFVDADACPVKNIIVARAKERGIPVTMVVDTSHEIADAYSRVVTVDKAQDSADYRIMSMLKTGDIVVTQDYGLAAMAIGKRAHAIHPTGLLFTDDNIDALLLDRHISAKARRSGSRTRGPRKRTQEDDRQFSDAFAQLLDSVIRV